MFSIEEKFDNEYFEEDDETDDEDKSDDSSITNEKKERYLIYKKDSETCRIVVPFKDTRVNEDEKIADDPRSGGKTGVKLNQENVLGEVSIYNRVYQGLE